MTTTHAINLAAIPDELKALPQWVCWKYVKRANAPKPTKLPYNAITGDMAESDNPMTWATFAQAVDCWEGHGDTFAGIGFVFSELDPYCGIDLDDCLNEQGEPHPSASRALSLLASYSEISPSGRGVKIIVRATKPGDSCKRTGIKWTPNDTGAIEIYDRLRYFTITGNVVPDSVYTIEDRQQQVNEFYAKVFAPKPAAPAKPIKLRGKASPIERCRKYLGKCPDSISGQGGHDKFLRAACECMRFGLSDSETRDLLYEWSQTKSGGEPWNEREIEHKIKSARDKVQAAGEIGSWIQDDPPERAQIEIIPPSKTGASAGVLDRIEAIASGRYASIDFPWPSITSLSQSLLPGTVTLVCGVPGAGKSFWLINAALHWVTMGVPFVIFMLEEDRTYHLQRALAVLEANGNLCDVKWIKAHVAEARAAWKRQEKTLDALGACIYDAPKNRMTLRDLSEWHEQIAPAHRVVVIDPITAASAGKDRYIEDGRFIERAKTVSLETQTSLMLITHPKMGRKKQAITLDDLAGGADFPRFTQTVIVIASHDAAEEVMCFTPFGRGPQSANRMIQLPKTRNAKGQGSAVAFSFGDDLVFNEIGLVCE